MVMTVEELCRKVWTGVFASSDAKYRRNDGVVRFHGELYEDI